MGKVIGIAGSARKTGNSTTLLEAVLRGATRIGMTTQVVHLDGLTFKGCQGCEKCSTTGQCILDDDLTPILEELKSAEGWVLASPIYYDGISGQMKTFFDRCRTFTKDPQTQKLKPQMPGKKKGIVLVTYADRLRTEYAREAAKLAKYLGWMGDFGKVEILVEGGLGSRAAAAQRPDLLARAEKLGEELFGWGAFQ